ncbi:MAG TPA: hypothetical protein VJ935_02605 [Acidimicrobiia bacterium]|nr:hypothetical protein [Acidimicrobiia bacterium]
MDEHLRQVFREEFNLDDKTPRAVRHRIGSFEPLLGEVTARVLLAASEVATAFARQREPDTSIELRLFGVDDLFRIEISNSLTEKYLLALEGEGQGFIRRQVLDKSTDRWGVLGDGAAMVWFEIAQAAAPREAIP